jgi:hypothetical protein
MATAGVAVGAIMAISPVFAQGTTPSAPTTSDTLLASILAAAANAGITLNAEQTKAITEAIADVGVAEQATANDTEDEDVDEDDDDTAEVAAAAATTKQEETKHTVTVTSAAPKSNEKSTEEKGDD